jgi:hypothetical protein
MRRPALEVPLVALTCPFCDARISAEHDDVMLSVDAVETTREVVVCPACHGMAGTDGDATHPLSFDDERPCRVRLAALLRLATITAAVDG